MTAATNPNDAARTTSWQNRAHIQASRLLGRLLGSGEWPAKFVANRARRAQRRGQPINDASPPRSAVRGLVVERSEHAGWPVWTLKSPKPSRPPRVVLYFHGGGYVGQANKMQYTWCADVVRHTGATVIVPIYPLAPIGTAATVVPVAADLIACVAAEHGADNVTVAGDSAGGGLALAATQEVIRRGSDSPSGLVLISPWLDVTVCDPASADIHVPAAGVNLLRAGGRLWAGDADPADPLVSPLFGPMSGLPPIVVFGGTFDVLHPDTMRLREQALAAGTVVDTVIKDGLVHVWPLYAHLPEAREIRPLLHRALLGHR